MLIDVSDLNKLAAEMSRSTGRLGVEAATAVRKTAAAVQRDAKALCPVGATGDLRRSISTSITGDGRGGSIEAEVGSDVTYARYVEYGTSVMAPEPYMGPALAKNTPAFVAGFEHIGGSIL